MNLIKRRQGGITFIGILLILAVLACFVLFVLKAFPLYNEYFAVKTAMNSVASQPADLLVTTRDIQKSFLKNVQLNNVQRFDDRSVKELVTIQKPEKKGQPRVMRVTYEARNVLFKNIYLLMAVDESIAIGGGAE
ncbi:MAG: hypothetical protein A2W28_07675 [Gammaproteobacteria bacterium RBG_16_51_14]|nr:MAG: hypothetical protein A2W28_07675 [Gammaproteobacteria bacterium RBG_16_51_14]